MGFHQVDLLKAMWARLHTLGKESPTEKEEKRDGEGGGDGVIPIYYSNLRDREDCSRDGTGVPKTARVSSGK